MSELLFNNKVPNLERYSREEGMDPVKELRSRRSLCSDFREDPYTVGMEDVSRLLLKESILRTVKLESTVGSEDVKELESR